MHWAINLWQLIPEMIPPLACRFPFTSRHRGFLAWLISVFCQCLPHCNSLASENWSCNLKRVIYKYIAVILILSVSCEIPLRWTPLNLIDGWLANMDLGNGLEPYGTIIFWRHDMEMISALLAFCEGITKKTMIFSLFFVVTLKYLKNKQWRCQWFEKPRRLCHVIIMIGLVLCANVVSSGTRFILHMRAANERRRYNVTSSPIAGRIQKMIPAWIMCW